MFVIFNIQKHVYAQYLLIFKIYFSIKLDIYNLDFQLFIPIS